jgi:anti-sigma-K factor RskA
MTMDRDNPIGDDWEGQLLEYTMGTLDPASAMEFERGLEECRTHVARAREYSLLIGALASGAPPAEPPSGHKERLMARLSSTPQQAAGEGEPSQATMAQPTPPRIQVVEPPTAGAAPRPIGEAQDGGAGAAPIDITQAREQRRASPFVPALLGAAAAVVLLLGLWLIVRALQPPEPESYRAVLLEGQPDYAGTTGVAVINPNTNDVTLIVSGLNPLPPEQVYELWFLLPQQGANPVPAGTFNANANGAARHSVNAPQDLSSYAGLAVTIEPAPGSPTPTGPIVIAGTYAAP